MHALIIQHDHVSPPGPVAERLAELGIETVLHPVVPKDRFADPGVSTEFPNPRDFELVIPMGSPWSVYDLDRIGAWVKPEMDLLREADEAGVAVLGICFGGQLLAQAHGGTVSRAERGEIGYTQVTSDDPALIAPGPWFEWHYDRWTLPPGAVEIARNDNASQAFHLRRNLAVQFHPELTTAMLRLWLAGGGDDQARGYGIDPADLQAAVLAEEGANRERTYALIDAFIDRFVTS